MTRSRRGSGWSPRAFNGGLTSRVPIQHFNANVSVLAQKPDELATMFYRVS
jgi:hypothetical protein